MVAFNSNQHTGLGTNGFEVSLNYITAIPDPNVLLCSNTLKLNFKSLLKRDPSTKEKSITSMLQYIKENPAEINEDLTVITWVQLYPKLSIDDSKKVRATSHLIQSQFVLSLGKSYSKYLKDTIGIWIAGLFDPDKSVSKSCVESFTIGFPNKANIVSTLWKLFIEQILNFCHQIIVLETEHTLSDERFATNDESEAKYLRMLKVSILMIVHSFNELSMLDLTENVSNLIIDIFSSEIFQNCFTSTDFGLKTASYKALRSIVVSKHAKSLITKDLYKSLVKSMIKGMKFNSKINILLYSSTIIPILDSIIAVTKYQDSFWTSIKKPIPKIIEFLKYGSLNSDVSYYSLINQLIHILPKEILDYSGSEFLQLFETITNNVLKEANRNFVKEGWNSVMKIIRDLAKDDLTNDNILNVFSLAVVKICDSNKFSSCDMTGIDDLILDAKNIFEDINLAVENSLHKKEIVYEKYAVKNQDLFIANYLKLLKSEDDSFATLLDVTINSLQEDSNSYILQFTIIDKMIPFIHDEETFEIVSTFIDTLPTYITESFLDIPLNLFMDYTQCKFADKKTVNAIGNEIFTTLDKLNSADKFLKLAPSLKNFNIQDSVIILRFLENQTSALSLSNKQTSTNLYSVAKTVDSAKILKELYQNEDFHEFLSNIRKHFDMNLFLQFVKEVPEFTDKLFEIAFVPIDDILYDDAQYVSEKLILGINEDENLVNHMVISLIDIISKFDGIPVTLTEKLMTLSDDRATSITQILLEKLGHIFEYPVDALSTINNDNEIVSYIFIRDYENKEKKIDLEVFSNAIDSLILLNSLKQHIDDVKIVDIILLINYINDVVSIKGNFSRQYKKKIANLQIDINSNNNELFDGADFFENLFVSSTNKYLQHLNDLVKDSNKTKSYYAFKYLSQETEIIADADSSKLSYDFKQLNGNAASILVLSKSARKFLTLSNFDYIRTNTIANIISIRKSEDILSIGLTQLIVLNSLLNIDLDSNIPANYMISAPQRFNMLLNILGSWLDSEIAYDENFKPVRVALMQFVRTYLNNIYCVCDDNYPLDFFRTVSKMGTRLVSESLNLINSEDFVSLDVLNASLETYFELFKTGQENEEWLTSLTDIETELIELFLKISQIPVSSAPLEIIGLQYGKLFESFVLLNVTKPFYEQLFKCIDSQNIEIQRSGCILLNKLIPEIQDNLVVELTLTKKKTIEDDTSGAQLPKILIENINNKLTDYIEFEEPWKVHQYLWSWCLILDHFKNITQQIRQDYINNIREEVINDFLNFIFDEFSLDKFTAPVTNNTQSADYFKTYDFKPYSLGEDVEIKEIFMVCLYEIMNNIGGTVAQNWFQSIKNKQLRTNVENFIIKNISPVLIKDILSSLSSKTTLEDADFKININSKYNEIKCLYHIDEQQMEISIILPPNYPLTQITVNGVSRVGVNEKKWKSWIMSAQYVINFQNGTILDSIKHFKDNVTANFENYEDCAICYSVLNAVDHSTPNKTCPTCKQNFHSACLYRWFKSSSSSTCPLCRSKFNFKKHS